MQKLDFRIEPPDGAPAVDVQMHGQFLDGVINEGDFVEVSRGDMRGGLVSTQHVRNHTTTSDVWMRTGVSGAVARTEAQWGRRLIRSYIAILAMIATVVLVGVTVGIVVAVSGTDLFGSDAAATVAVPDVTGLGGNEAADKLSTAGLHPVPELEESSDVPFGKVVRTKPRAGETVQVGSSVVMYEAT